MSQLAFQRAKSSSDSQNHSLLFSKENAIPRFLTLSWITESSKHSTQGTYGSLSKNIHKKLSAIKSSFTKLTFVFLTEIIQTREGQFKFSSSYNS